MSGGAHTGGGSTPGLPVGVHPDPPPPAGPMVLIDIPWQLIYLTLLQTHAVRSTSHALTGLARNALIRKLDVKLTAKAADLTALSVAQIRTTQGVGKLLTIVIDFGTLVTVSGMKNAEPSNIATVRVKSWNGSTFQTQVYRADVKTSQYTEPDASTTLADVKQVSPSTSSNIVFSSEVRTERLQIEVLADFPASVSNTTNKVVESLQLYLPDAPSGLDLVTDAGLRLFNQVPPVIPIAGSTDAVTAQDWNKNYERLVHLAPLLAPLAGDPLAKDALPINLTLSSRVPGVLEIAEEGTHDIAWLERMGIGPDDKRDLVFAEEGLAKFPLTIAASTYAKLESGRVTMLGKPGPARVLPPIGPAANVDLELVISPTLAMVCRIPSARLEKLTGVRLALAAGPEGAEVKVIALADDHHEPGLPLERAESKPVTLPAGGAAADAPWTTFELDPPIDLTAEPSPWIAILVSRGKVGWSMGQYATATDALPVRRGPPGGPYVKLPSMFQSTTGFLDTTGVALDLTRLGARVRAIGIPPANTPIAPYRFAITQANAADLEAGGGLAVTPTAKGVAIDFKAATALDVAAGTQVQVVSLVADTLTLRDLDVTLTK